MWADGLQETTGHDKDSTFVNANDQFLGALDLSLAWLGKSLACDGRRGRAYLSWGCGPASPAGVGIISSPAHLDCELRPLTRRHDGHNDSSSQGPIPSSAPAPASAPVILGTGLMLNTPDAACLGQERDDRSENLSLQRRDATLRCLTRGCLSRAQKRRQDLTKSEI